MKHCARNRRLSRVQSPSLTPKLSIENDRFAAWEKALEQRHLADLRFQEVTRALRALSMRYVERRETLGEGAAFRSAGKRAAYALYYGPLHFLTVQEIIRALDASNKRITQLFDCGCGTGAAGAAWATALPASPRVIAVDAHPWAVAEAAFTYRHFAVDADVRRGDLARITIPRSVDAIVAGWVMNELAPDVRDQLLPRLLSAAASGCRVLIVEPIARRVSPWWPAWADAFIAAGGRADEWKFRITLPELVRRLDRASGMRHDELKARSLYV